MGERVLYLRAAPAAVPPDCSEVAAARPAPARAAAVVADFVDLIGRLSERNGHDPAWWYTWLSCRDQHNAPLLRLSLRLAAIEAALEGAEPLQAICPEPGLAAAVRRLARRRSWRVRQGLRDRLIWGWRRFLRPVRDVVDGARVLRLGLRLVSAARRHPLAEGIRPDVDDVLVTVLHQRPQPPAQPFHDVYFGPVPRWLAAQGRKVLVVGQVLGDAERMSADIAGLHDPAVATLGHALTFADVFRAVGWALVRRPALSGQGDADLLLPEGVGRPVIDLGTGKLFELATRRLLQAAPHARVVHIYENNPWEHAVNRMARAAGRASLGFLHCAVLPSHLKNIITESERSLRPGPDRILCTGPVARDIFLSLGAHDPVAVGIACDLRGAVPVAGLALRQTPPAAIRRVIVILEGLEKMTALLRFMDQAARLSPHIRFELREHPAFPLDRLAPLAGIAVGEDAPLRRSAPPVLTDALAAADAAIYQGSTAALTAGWMGLPLIRFDSGEIPTDDPLHRCTALKRTVSRPEELAATLESFAVMDGEAFARELAELRAHITAYLAPPTEAAMAAFLPSRDPA